MQPRVITAAPSYLRPQDLWPSWQAIDLQEQTGDLSPTDAKRWNEGIYGLIVLWGLEPDELIDAIDVSEFSMEA